MSLLNGVLKRLMSLQDEDNNGELKQRFFEKNGERKCSVKYNDQTKMFELEVYMQGEKPKIYQFDNVDMVAIDVFDIMSADD
ncbi:DUF1797 family protein [Calidifontibacillus oryziterrae]|uniref:DUF1797 family protein n=1 Tax=Calidifontibacillus oryziterrae TaxID=1191699 RepID=UPI0002ED69EF|nr:DUF1797 family protein [Calidifontibacillus oryziterrae]